jgi:hypothetical protein
MHRHSARSWQPRTRRSIKQLLAPAAPHALGAAHAGRRRRCPRTAVREALSKRDGPSSPAPRAARPAAAVTPAAAAGLAAASAAAPLPSICCFQWHQCCPAARLGGCRCRTFFSAAAARRIRVQHAACCQHRLSNPAIGSGHLPSTSLRQPELAGQCCPVCMMTAVAALAAAGPYADQQQRQRQQQQRQQQQQQQQHDAHAPQPWRSHSC